MARETLGAPLLVDSPIYEKLKSIADDFSCGEWGTPNVFSPGEYRQFVQREFQRLPNEATKQRLDVAGDQWVFRFGGGRVANSRGTPGHSVHDARAFFTPAEARDLPAAEIRNVLIATLAEREVHEIFEWAQLKSRPGVPIVDPHQMSDDLYDVVSWVANTVLRHAPPPGRGSADDDAAG